MNEMYNRIERLCKERGINITQMCREADIPRGNLTDLKMGRTAALSTKNLGKISLYFTVSMDYLLGNVSEPFLTKNEKGILDIDIGALVGTKKAPTPEDECSNKVVNIIPMPDTYRVPLIGNIACGQPILAVEDAEETVEVPSWVKADFALRCKGESMINARIFDGDIVYIHKQPNVDNGQIAAVRVGDEATLKKVYYNGQRLILRAANPLFPDLEYEGFELEDIEILGKAVAFTSMLLS